MRAITRRALWMLAVTLLVVLAGCAEKVWIQQFDLAKARFDAGRYDEAAAAARRSIAAYPRFPPAWAYLGMAEFKMGDRSAAISAFTTCIEVSQRHGFPQWVDLCRDSLERVRAQR